jgi:hypothetical protein
MFFDKKHDILFDAVDNEDIILVRQILKNYKNKVDREKAYNHAISNNSLEIAYTIRKSYISD